MIYKIPIESKKNYMLHSPSGTSPDSRHYLRKMPVCIKNSIRFLLIYRVLRNRLRFSHSKRIYFIPNFLSSLSSTPNDDIKNFFTFLRQTKWKDAFFTLMLQQIFLIFSDKNKHTQKYFLTEKYLLLKKCCFCLVFLV